jgi:hypothetical protein
MTAVENKSGAKQCTLEPAHRKTRDNSTGLDKKHTFVTFIHFHSECYTPTAMTLLLTFPKEGGEANHVYAGTGDTKEQCRTHCVLLNCN